MPLVQNWRYGNLWVQQYSRALAGYPLTFSSNNGDAPEEWMVFNTSGEWLGNVPTRAGFRVRAIGRDFISGVWQGEDEVQLIHVYRLRKPGSG